MMTEADAISALTALAQEHRLRMFRLLVRHAPEGLVAGEIAEATGIGATGASFHLKELERAGLIVSRRQGRFIRYAIQVPTMRALLAFLAEDCCQGRSELCRDLLAVTPPSCGSHPVDKGHQNMTAGDKIYNVLFLCTHNSARSVLAECLINRLGVGKFRGFSAGSQPRGQVHPYALELLSRMNHDVAALRSKSWEEFARADAPPLDFVFTVCDDAANEVCPVWPGQPMTAHWGVPDPSRVEGTEAEKRFAFADTYRMLGQRIDIFVNLPLASLDKLTLQKRLTEIGRTGAATSESGS